MDIITLKEMDKKVLHELDKNSRISFAQLGKKVHLSKNAVAQRVKNLQKQGVLQSFYPVINYAKIGRHYCTVEVKLQSTNMRIEKDMLKYISAIKRISWLGFQQGEYQFVFVLLTEDIHNVNLVLKRFKNKFSRHVVGTRFSVMNKLYHFKHKFLNPECNTYVVSGGPISCEADEQDEKIIELLVKDARRPLFEIANKLGVSAKTIKKRIDGMVKKKVILEFKIKLDFTKLGYHHYHIFLDMHYSTPEKEQQVINYLKVQPEIYFIDEVIGRGDLDFELYLKSNKDLHDFMNRMKDKFHALIRNHSFAVVYNVHEEKYY